MLVLSRKESEDILIGNDIVVSIIRISGSKVSIGITAPKSVTILRNEIVEKVRNDNSTAKHK